MLQHPGLPRTHCPVVWQLSLRMETPPFPLATLPGSDHPHSKRRFFFFFPLCLKGFSHISVCAYCCLSCHFSGHPEPPLLQAVSASPYVRSTLQPCAGLQHVPVCAVLGAQQQPVQHSVLSRVKGDLNLIMVLFPTPGPTACTSYWPPVGFHAAGGSPAGQSGSVPTAHVPSLSYTGLSVRLRWMAALKARPKSR